MSRIFEALRRVEQLNETSGTKILTGKLGQGAESFKPLVTDPDGLGDIDRVTCRLHPQSHLLGTGQGTVVAMERFKLLRYRLYELRQRRALKSVLITSSVPREGKSMVAANLAITLAQASERVLLVDADLRKPSLHALFGWKPTAGLADVLQGRIEFMEGCRRLDPLQIFLLPAGKPPANPVELIQGETMRGVMKRAASTFDWVVLDSPPVLPLADGRFLAALSDVVLLVAREGHTCREELQESLATLKGAPTAGIVLNASRSANLDAYSGYYSAMTVTAAMKNPAQPAQQKPQGKESHIGQVS